MIAAEFHRIYEAFAPVYGYQTQEASAKPWDEVPEQNRLLMTAVVAELIASRTIAAPVHTDGELVERYADRHPSVTGVLRFLRYSHLSDPGMRELSEQFSALAAELLERLPDDPELTAALRKLREAKDCAVGLAAVARRSTAGHGKDANSSNGVGD